MCNLSYSELREGFYAKLSNRIQYPIEDIRPCTESQFDNLEREQHKQELIEAKKRKVNNKLQNLLFVWLCSVEGITRDVKAHLSS